ncbi:MAG: trigger factor [Dehalococcoidia bacterium]|nr:MAG: trigger factor [Dehalococcoidia bacterium]
MKVLDRKNENHQEIFKVELDEAETDAAMEAAYEHLVKEVNIDGFRKGKVPRDVLEHRVGKDAIFDEAMKRALPDLIDGMLVENKVRAYATPMVRVTTREPVIFEATVPLPPDITLGDYNAIKMKPNPVVIEDKAVEDILERAQHQTADWEPTGAPAELKDMAVLDIESDVEGTPYVVEKEADFQLLPGWRFPVPGFAEELVGMKAGDEREFSLKMPDTYPDKAKAGKDVHFKVKVSDIRREKMPELNDEFAQKVAPGCGGIEKLREALKADLQHRAQDTEDKAFEEKVIDTLVEKSQIEFPPLLTENEAGRMVQEYVDRVRSTTQNEEEFKSVLKMTSEEKLLETYRPQAEQRVKRNLVISKLIESEKLEVDDADVDLQIAALTAEAGDKVQEQTTYLNKPENRDTLRWWLKTGKAKKLLVEKAQAD